MTLKKQSSIRIVGIGDAARKLGCSREHLRLVITGRRTSRRLVAKARAMGIRLPHIEKEFKV